MINYNQNPKMTFKEKILKKLGLVGADFSLMLTLALQLFSIFNYIYKLVKFNFYWRKSFLQSLGGFIGPVIGSEGKTYINEST